MSSKPNEVEILLELLTRMVEKRAEENPKGGIRINDEFKMKYTRMQETLAKLRTYVLDWGEIRGNNVCEECDNYHNGRCQASNRDIRTAVNPYHTCWRNTNRRYNGKEFVYPKYPSEKEDKG